MKKALRNIAFLLSYLRNAVFCPLPFLRRLNPAGGFGAWRVNLAFSPDVKVAGFRRRVGGGGVAWLALWRAFPQPQELIFDDFSEVT